MGEQLPNPFGNYGNYGNYGDYGGHGGYGGYGGNGFNWGNAFGGIGDMIGGYYQMNMPNPSNSAMPYYNKIPGMLNGVYEPWMKAGMNAVNPYLNYGKAAGGMLSGQVNNLLNNPGGFINSLGQGFKQSPGYGWQTQQAQQAVNNAAAAGGMAGSPLQQQNSANVVNQLANQDYYNWMNHAIGMYNTGFQGAQNMYDTGANIANSMYGAGANMANNYGTNLADAYMNMGNMAYMGQENQNEQTGGGIGGLIGGGLDLASAFGWL